MFLVWKFGQNNRQKKDAGMKTLAAFQKELVKSVKTIKKVINIPKFQRLSFNNHISLRLKINVGTKKERPRFDILADTSDNVKKIEQTLLYLAAPREQNAFD